MTPEERAEELLDKLFFCDDRRDRSDTIAAAIHAAVAEAVAGEREANCAAVCWLCAKGERVQFTTERMDEWLGWWHLDVAGGRGAGCRAASIRARSRGEGEQGGQARP